MCINDSYEIKEDKKCQLCYISNYSYEIKEKKVINKVIDLNESYEIKEKSKHYLSLSKNINTFEVKEKQKQTYQIEKNKEFVYLLGIKKDLVIDKKVESFIIGSLKKPNLMINLNHVYEINSKSSDNKETNSNNYEIKYLEKTNLKRINQGSFFIINNKKNISDKDRNKKEEDIKELNEISRTKNSDNNQKYDEKEYKKVYEIYSQNIEIIPELFKKKEKISIEKINEQNIEINQFDIQIFRIKKDTLIRAFNEEFSILNDKNNIKKRVEMIEKKKRN